MDGSPQSGRASGCAAAQVGGSAELCRLRRSRSCVSLGAGSEAGGGDDPAPWTFEPQSTPVCTLGAGVWALACGSGGALYAGTASGEVWAVRRAGEDGGARAALFLATGSPASCARRARRMGVVASRANDSRSGLARRAPVRTAHVTTGAVLLGRHADGVYALAAADGGALLSASADGQLRVWDAAGASFHEFEVSAESVYALTVSADGCTAVTGGEDCAVRVWRLSENGAAIAETACLDGHDLPVTALALASNGVLVSGSEDQTVRLWRAGSNGNWAQRGLLDGHAAAVTSLVVSGDLLLTGSWDRTVRAWRCDWAVPTLAAACVAVLRDDAPQHTGGSVLSLALCPDERHVYAGCGDRLLRAWDAAALPLRVTHGCATPTELQPLQRVEGHRRAVTSVLATPVSGCSGELLTGCVDRVLRRLRVTLPVAWSDAAHPLYPSGFRLAIVVFLLAMRRGEGTLAVLGSLDPDTRDGIARRVAAALAEDAYGAGGSGVQQRLPHCASRCVLGSTTEEGEEDEDACAL